MANEYVPSFAQFEEVRYSCFNPGCDTSKSLDSCLDDNLDPIELPRTLFEATANAVWHTAAVYSAETTYLQLCEELRRKLNSFFRQVDLIFQQIQETRHISGSILLCFAIEILCTLAQLYGARCCGRTVKEVCLEITFSERNTQEVDDAIAAEVQTIYDHIMNAERAASVNTRLEGKTKRFESLLSQHHRSWMGFMSTIFQVHDRQTYNFVRELAPDNQMIICQICMDHLPEAQFPNAKITERCDHMTTACLECISHSLSSQLGAKSWDRVACPICLAVFEFKEIELYASVDIVARYQRFMIADTLKDDPEYRQCLRPGCTFGQLHEDGDKAPLVRCGDCSFRMCYVHNIPWHEGQTCSEYNYKLGHGDEKKHEEEASEAAVAKISKPCPGCKSPIEKNEGCDHMTCRKCRHEFCWKCFAPYDLIFSHGNGEHRRNCPYHSDNIPQEGTAVWAL